MVQLHLLPVSPRLHNLDLANRQVVKFLKYQRRNSQYLLHDFRLAPTCELLIQLFKADLLSEQRNNERCGYGV